MASINVDTLYNGTNGFATVLTGFNEVTNYVFGDILLAAVFLIIIFMLRNFIFRDAFLSASTVTFIVSILFWASGFTTFTRSVVCFSILVLAIAYSYFNDPS